MLCPSVCFVLISAPVASFLVLGPVQSRESSLGGSACTVLWSDGAWGSWCPRPAPRPLDGAVSLSSRQLSSAAVGARVPSRPPLLALRLRPWEFVVRTPQESDVMTSCSGPRFSNPAPQKHLCQRFDFLLSFFSVNVLTLFCVFSLEVIFTCERWRLG